MNSLFLCDIDLGKSSGWHRLWHTDSYCSRVLIFSGCVQQASQQGVGETAVWLSWFAVWFNPPGSLWASFFLLKSLYKFVASMHVGLKFLAVNQSERVCGRGCTHVVNRDAWMRHLYISVILYIAASYYFLFHLHAFWNPYSFLLAFILITWIIFII